ncbi:Putative sterol regulatory element-binding protein cleavage-activating protein [Septoria linicola]|uniref:Sterol regulatory element-binding protein cleavage-activating protein n=1 Tax=Septoria linicola TaxID=215465 RepID=A0A9Q9EE40_9PEZI|nr:putative sterol regulatory element-binding protein cleavage-activating protein [Septoria linicola]USW47475.1 Putative sterol regulatory element-binding protein cleavage-activating protein [Septoria linicola]
MLWYLLSPLRGITQPPRLPSNHPVRKAFYRHGKTTAQHWLWLMLISVAIAMGFSYPTIFLSENPTAGLAAYPQHVWTTAKLIDKTTVPIDIELRQIWVHGSYMDALNKDVLKRGLAVQQLLVGNEDLGDIMHSLDDKLRSSAVPWAFHSPLMYWNNSADLIDADHDIVRTINEQKHSSSSLNVVLRPASVFAGKKFDRTRLQAADALVITLMNKGGSDIGDRWHDKMQTLAEGACPGCTLFPSDGHRVYKFSFTPLSVSEHLALTFAYSAMAIYVLLSFRRMRAFRSRGGLVVTAITQMTCSILSSFTICHILKITLSTIPQNAYPFVVLVLGVENIFRLINAVLAYPPTMATELRIANALGDIGPVSVAAAAQNLAVLALLSTVVSPGVAAFCAFAAIATVFDAFFLLTFFVAVLSVDIKRLELQDALAARHNKPRRRKQSPRAAHTWIDALLQGRLPFSTRMAGTVVTMAFVLSLNYHFSERKGAGATIRDVLNLIKSRSGPVAEIDTFAPPPMNASLTPAEWMRMQDFDTAKEVMRLAKPGSDSFVIRLFAPLVVVLSGSDRTDVPVGEMAWTQTLRSFAVHHFYPVIVAIIFIVAFVAVLMNFLLYSDVGDEDNDLATEHKEDALTCDTVSLPHRLDIVKMAGSQNGHFVTIALDRSIAVAITDPLRQTYHRLEVPNQVLKQIAWPIRHLAIDDRGEWIAYHCSDDRIFLYRSTDGTLISSTIEYPDDHPAAVFTFTILPTRDGSKLFFTVLTSGGRLRTTSIDTGSTIAANLTHLPIVSALVEDTMQGRQLFVIGMEATINAFAWTGNSWELARTAPLSIETESGHLGPHVTSRANLQLYRDLEAEILVVTTPISAIFIDSCTLEPLAKLDVSTGKPNVDMLMVGSSRLCPACGSLALRGVATASEQSAADACVVTTWSVDDNSEACICLAQRLASCRPFSPADYETHSITSPGAWSSVRSQAVIGLRKRPFQSDPRTEKQPCASQLRQRKRNARLPDLSNDMQDAWQAYKLSINGDLQVLELSDMEAYHDRSDSLYVDNAGPAITLDSQSVAVAFGNSVKVIRSSRTGASSRRPTLTALDRQASISKRASIRKVK